MNFSFFCGEYYVNGYVVVFSFHWDLEPMLLMVTKSCHPDFNKACSSTQLLILNSLTMLE